MIVFNQPLNQLGSRQRVSLAQRAGALAAELLTAPLSSEITHALGLDRFEIGARATGAGVAPMVTVGEQIGERVFVKFTQQLGPQDLSEFVLELRLADYLRLQTSLSEGSNLVCIPVSSPGVRHVRRSDRRRGVQE